MHFIKCQKHLPFRCVQIYHTTTPHKATISRKATVKNLYFSLFCLCIVYVTIINNHNTPCESKLNVWSQSCSRSAKVIRSSAISSCTFYSRVVQFYPLTWKQAVRTTAHSQLEKGLSCSHLFPLCLKNTIRMVISVWAQHSPTLVMKSVLSLLSSSRLKKGYFRT